MHQAAFLGFVFFCELFQQIDFLLANGQSFSNFFLFFERRNWNLNAQEVWYTYLFSITNADDGKVQILLNEDVGLKKQPVKVTVQFSFWSQRCLRRADDPLIIRVFNAALE